MSVRIMSMVWDAPFPTPTAKVIALKLADHANDEGANVYPSKATIEEKTGCSRSAVKEWLSIYDACGLLVVNRTGRGGNPQDTTVRRFNVELLADLINGQVVFWEHEDGWSLACPLNPLDGEQQSRQKTRSPKNPVSKMGKGGRQKPKTGVPSAPKPSKNHQEPSARDRAPSEGSNFDLEGKGVRDRLRHHFSDQVFRSWFAEVAFSHQVATAIAEAPNKIVRDWLQKQYEPDLLAACRAEWPNVTTIKIVSNDNIVRGPKRASR